MQLIMNTFRILLLLLAPMAGLAQQSAIGNQQMTNAAGTSYAPNDNVMRTFDNRFEGTIGSPYLINEWMPAEIVDKQGNRYADVLIRYNVLDDNIAVVAGEGGSIDIAREEIAEFSIFDYVATYRFLAIPSPKGPKHPDMFCHVLLDGDCQVLVRRRKYYVPSSATTAFANQDMNEYKFHPNRYYVRRQATGELLRVGRTNGKLFDFLGHHETELRQLSRKNQLFVTEPMHLVLLVRMANNWNQ